MLSDSILVVALLALGVLGAALAGILVGVAALRRVPRPLLASFAVGALLFLLFDLLKESAGLGQGILGDPWLQIALLVNFAAGALFAPLLPRRSLAALWAAGIALHGMGEGWVLGSEDAAASEVLRAPGALSFLLHKGIEAFTIPVLAGTISLRRTLPLAAALAGTALLAALASSASPGGPPALPLLLFAAGAGATSWAILRLARLGDVDARHVGAMVLGAVAVYAAGLLHEV